MSHAAKKLLHTLDSLPEAERREVIRELLRRIAFAPHEPLGDEELSSAADDVFRDLQQGETEE